MFATSALFGKLSAPTQGFTFTAARAFSSHGHAVAHARPQRPITSKSVFKVQHFADSPARLLGHAVTVWEDQLLTYHQNQAYVYNLAKSSWLPVPRAPAAPPGTTNTKVQLHTVANVVYGLSPAEKLGKRFYKYDSVELELQQLPDPPLSNFQSVVVGRKLYVLGRPFMESPDNPGIRVFSWDLENDDLWIEEASVFQPGYTPKERDNLVVTSSGDKIVVFYSNQDNNEDVQVASLDTTTSRWEAYPPKGDHPGKLLNFTATTMSDGKIAVVGGLYYEVVETHPHYHLEKFTYHQEPVSTTYLFDPATGAWEQTHVDGKLPPRFHHRALRLPNTERILLVGGTNDLNNKTGCLEIFSLDRATLGGATK
jgi:hypothetical protein